MILSRKISNNKFFSRTNKFFSRKGNIWDGMRHDNNINRLQLITILGATSEDDHSVN